jgi:predicted GNAT superfamily acetyltransferase
METWPEYRACEALQRDVWGEGFSELVPASVLKIARAVGGVASGAFEEEDGLAGFVFGLTGVRDGRRAHWSHMLAVRPEARGRDLGFRLKRYQCELLLPLGVETVWWTYDPLVSKNAHLNLVRLGARVVRYVRDYYGDGSDSALSAGLGTDRFIVEWPIAEARVAVLLAGAAGASPEADAGAALAAPVVNTREGAAGPEPVVAEPPAASAAPAVRVEIPEDVQAVRDADRAAAALWRASTRRALEACLERGDRVAGFFRLPDPAHPGAHRSFYWLRSGG